MRCIAHRRDIGAEVDSVGDEKRKDENVENPAWIVIAKIGRDSVAGRGADARANLLDRHHERKGERHRPAHGIAELRADLAVGRNAPRIVVGRAGNESWPQRSKYPPCQRELSLAGLFAQGFWGFRRLGHTASALIADRTTFRYR